MKKSGTVIETQDGYAVVRMQRGAPGCGGGSCPLNSPLLDYSSSNALDIRAENPMGASTGERVWVELSDTQALGIAFFTYLFPIILVVGVFALVNSLALNAWVQAVSTIGTAVFAFLVLKRMDRLASPRYRVVDVLGEEIDCSSCPLQKEEENEEDQ